MAFDSFNDTGFPDSPEPSTWEWDRQAQEWTHSPNAFGTRGGALVWDELRQRMLGFSGPSAFEWNDFERSWKLLPASWSNDTTLIYALYDSSKDTFVVFDETLQAWEIELQGNTVKSRTDSIIAPPSRKGPAMVFDPSLRKVILFGGSEENNTLADTWEWDLATGSWTQRASLLPGRPPPRFGASMTYDKRRRKVLLLSDDILWEWHNSAGTWTELPVSFAPFSGQGDIVFDETNQQLLYIGEGTWTLKP